MTDDQAESAGGTGRKLRGWQVALAAVGACVLMVAGGAALALLLPGGPHLPGAARSETPSAVIPTFGLPTQTDVPVQAETPGVALPDLSEIAGAWCIPKVGAQNALVLEVIDGATVRVRMDADASDALVRYAGIEAPPVSPPGQFMALEALAINAGLVDGRHVSLVRDVTDADKDGKLPRYVLADGVFVNLELVMHGAARAAPGGPDMACFMTLQQAEQQATAARLGLWSQRDVKASPTSGIGEFCNCRGRDLDCRDFHNRVEAQSCFRYCKLLGFGDVFHLDNNADGLVCPTSK